MKIGGIAWLAVALVAACPALSDDFKEESTFFRVNIGGHVIRLEGLIVKRLMPLAACRLH